MVATLSAHMMRQHCEKQGIAPTTFGRQSVGDPRLIHDVANGRELRPKTAGRIREFMATPRITTNAASRFKRPGGRNLDQHPVLTEIEEFLSETGLTATQFGIAALADPNLVFDLRNGRDPRRPTVARIRHYIETGDEL